VLSRHNFVSLHPQLFVQQRKGWTQILIDGETRNPYVVMDANRSGISTGVCKWGGFRSFLSR
jgi:hypothetical protein